MGTRPEKELRKEIKEYIRKWKDTIMGQQIERMYKKGYDLYTICDACGINYMKED